MNRTVLNREGVLAARMQQCILLSNPFECMLSGRAAARDASEKPKFSVIKLAPLVQEKAE